MLHTYQVDLENSSNKTRFSWSKRNINWFITAEKYSTLYSKVLYILQPYLEDTNTAIDIGCGIGSFTIELAKKSINVTAFDRSPLIIETVNMRKKQYNLDNINAYCMPFEFLSNNMKYDLVLMSYMTGLIKENNLDKIMSLSNSYIVLILPVDSLKNDFEIIELYKKLGLDISKLNQSTYKDIIQTLENRNIEYELNMIESEFGQPFNTKEDAYDFFEYYFRIPYDKSLELRDWVEQKLVSKQKYYYFPNKKTSAVIIMKTHSKR